MPQINISYDAKKTAGEGTWLVSHIRTIDYPMTVENVTFEMIIGGWITGTTVDATFHFEEVIDLAVGKHTIEYAVLHAPSLAGEISTWHAEISARGRSLASGEAPYIDPKDVRLTPIRATFFVLPGGITIPLRMPSLGVFPSFIGPLQRTRRVHRYDGTRISIDEISRRRGKLSVHQ